MTEGPALPANSEKASPGVRTDFLAGLLGYNARRTSLHLVACFVRDLADLQLKPVGFSLLCLVGHNPGITSRQLCAALGMQPPNLVALVARTSPLALALARQILSGEAVPKSKK